MRHRTMLFTLLLLACSASWAQDVAARRLTKAKGRIDIDGNLGDDGWQGATRFDTWYETNPGDNVAPKVKSVGMVTFDDRFLYVGLEMWDPHPEQIRSTYGDHDNINGQIDDYAGVLLATRDERKTGYLFLVNFRNVQYDAVTDDTSGNEDSSPDFYWDSATKRTDHGWNIELRIPFSSLRYKGANPEQWGLSLYRNMPRERRYQMFTDKLPRGKNCFVCSWGTVSGLEGLPAGGHLVAAPYATARELGETRDGLGSSIVHQPVSADEGLDVKWTPNADTAVDGTINPDFSQVESDVAAISTNQRFAIFYPEKRPFFLEGTELFNTPIQAVYTRTITSPRWGIRSTGKYGSDAYTLLVADDRGGGSAILPSALGSDFADQNFATIAAIGRVRHDLGDTSFVSFLGTDRQGSGSYNRVFGPDFQFKKGNQTLTGQFLMSDSRTPNQSDLASEWDGRKLRSHAGDLWYQYQTRSNDLYSEYKDYGNDFRADDGFVPQVGYRSSFTEIGHTFWPKDRFFSRVRSYAMGQYDSLQNGDRLYSLFSVGFGADGKYRSFTRVRYAYDKVRTDDLAPVIGRQQVFTRHQLLYDIEFGLSKVLSFVTFSGWVGQDIDFANNRLARGADTQVTATLRTNDHLQLDLSNDVRWLNEDMPVSGTRGRLFTAQVERVRAMYTFNSRMFVRGIVQNQRTNRNVNFYTSDVPTHGGSIATQFLFAYKVNWQTLMYVGVGDLRQATADEGDLRPSNRQYFMKVSYAFQR